MRDPKRIDRILKIIRKNWKKKSHLRLGQFLYNTIWKQDAPLFYIEDDKLEQLLKDKYGKI